MRHKAAKKASAKRPAKVSAKEAAEVTDGGLSAIAQEFVPGQLGTDGQDAYAYGFQDFVGGDGTFVGSWWPASAEGEASMWGGCPMGPLDPVAGMPLVDPLLQVKNYKTTPCWHFERGNCLLGERCCFAHGEADLRGPSDPLKKAGDPSEDILMLCGAWGALATRKPLPRSYLLSFQPLVPRSESPPPELKTLASATVDREE